ncbi:MAG: amidohydrolase family protein, partial [Sphaerospermopsis sp. SIO1G2]|nr:amidohydrolase family protein [Sphaerospermopsis sp. SIO1G2]
VKIAAFTEGYDPEIVNYHAKHTLFYYRSLREIATLLNCEPEETAILTARQNLGIEKLTQISFDAANLEAIYLDDRLTSEDIFPVSWHQKFTTAKRILCIELLAEKLMAKINDFHNFVNAFIQAIDPPSSDIIAFKSIACYRAGLNIKPVAPAVAAVHFYDFKQQQKNQPLRLNDKHIIDFILQLSLTIASKYQIPVQLHTGLGDPDLDLRLANPLNLRYLLESPEYKNTPLVLLHASYPYMREAGYLASMYPQVYLDFGLAVPFLSVAGMRNTITQLLELIPTTKLMYSSDAHSIPELYYLGAKWGRQLLGEVLETAIEDTDINSREAENIALRILRENALNLYRQKKG